MSYKPITKTSPEVKVALEAREQSRTFRSKVGVAFTMYDGRIFGGFNIEKYGYGGYHAEEVGILLALSKGYRGDDFKRMVEVYQDAGHNKVEIYPACPNHCWGTLHTYTNPNLEIVVVSTAGKTLFNVFMREIIALPGKAQVYPSNEIKKAKVLRNVAPRSAIGAEVKIDRDYTWNEHGDGYTGGLIACAFDHKDYAITFDQKQFVFDGAAFGMKDGSAFGGFDVQSYYYKGYRAEEMAAIQAMSKGYSNKDFEAVMLVVPEFVERRQQKAFLAMQWQTWGILSEFANSDTRIYAVMADDKRDITPLGPLKNMGKLMSGANISGAVELKGTKPRFDGAVALSKVKRGE